MAGFPRPVRRLERPFISISIFANPFGHNFSPRQQSARSDTEKIITSGASRPTIPLDKRMDPIEPPKAVRPKLRRRPDVPILLNGRDKPVHPISHFIKVGRFVIAYVDRLLSETAAKLRNIRDSNMIKRPKHVLIEGHGALR